MAQFLTLTDEQKDALDDDGKTRLQEITELAGSVEGRVTKTHEETDAKRRAQDIETQRSAGQIKSAIDYHTAWGAKRDSKDEAERTAYASEMETPDNQQRFNYGGYMADQQASTSGQQAVWLNIFRAGHELLVKAESPFADLMPNADSPEGLRASVQAANAHPAGWWGHAFQTAFDRGVEQGQRNAQEETQRDLQQGEGANGRPPGTGQPPPPAPNAAKMPPGLSWDQQVAWGMEQQAKNDPAAQRKAVKSTARS